MNYKEFCEKAKELGWQKTTIKEWNGLTVTGEGGNVAFQNRKLESNLWDIISYDQVQRIGYDKIIAFMEKYKEEQVKA